MPTSNPRVFVNPGRADLALIGGDGPSATLAVKCWAALLRRALPTDLRREDWNLLADVLNGTMFDPSWTGAAVAFGLEEAAVIRPELPAKWYGKAKAAKRTKALRDLLRELDYAGAWAVITTVRRFWAGDADAETDWWLPRAA